MKILYRFLFLFIALPGLAQEFPVLNQYVFDPYLVNPSLVARQGHELNLLYRQQWSGIEDSPTTAVFNAQYRLNPKIGLGFNLFNDKVVLLSSTSIMGTFGYRIPITRRSLLSFGLSAGGYANKIDLDAATDDPTDPVIVKANGTFRMDGQFGMNFTHERLSLGFSLLHLFDNNPFTEGNFTELKFNELRNRAFMGSYRIDMGPNFTFTPYALYRYNGNYGFVETHGILEYRNQIMIGAFYRQSYGLGLIFRMKLNGRRLEAGYSHEFAGKQAQSFAGGSHELQMKYRFGPMEEPNRIAETKTIDSTSASNPEPVVAQVQQQEKEQEKVAEAQVAQETEVKAAQQESDRTPEPVKTTEKTQNTDVQVARTTQANSLQPATQTEETAEAKPIRYSLVVGSFKSSSNALERLREVKAKGLKGEVKFSKQTGYYYVVLPEYDVDKPSVDEVYQLRKSLPYNDVWYLKGIRN